jgi:hypothetical protein
MSIELETEEIEVVNVQPPPWLNPFDILPIKAVSVGSSATLIGFPCAEGRWYFLKENGVHRETNFRGSPMFRVFSESSLVLATHAFFSSTT